MAFCEKMPEAFPVSDRDGGSQDGLPLAKAEPICDGDRPSGTGIFKKREKNAVQQQPGERSENM